jgi:enamine deaminase RidA (YjgF/YER057c/UK114 family)
MNPESRLATLAEKLPPAPKPSGIYVPVLIVDRAIFVSGHGPLRADGTLIIGRVGADLDLSGGKAAARQTGLAILASLRASLGSLNRIRRVVKTLGMVNATPDFGEHPKVINGCSDLLVAVLGERGRHARSAVGMGSLPFGIPVEIEAVMAIVS